MEKSAVLYSMRLMRQEDVAQVTAIDREAFYSQWPPPNYRQELQNRLARYIVACDETKIPEEIEEKPVKVHHSLVSRIMGWFNSERFFGDEVPPGGQHIVGFAGIWVLADEAHITNIAVRKHYQRQGIGEMLLIAAIDLARKLKADTMTLEVRASNISAQNLYRKLGFTQVGLRRAYYTDNREDGVLMSTESINSDSFHSHLDQLKEAHSTKWGITDYQTARNHQAQPEL